MTLFHASKFDFVVGQVVEATEPTLFYADAVAEIERLRPTSAPSRSTCVFASDSAEFAVFFLMRQQIPLTDIQLYAVELPIHWKSPFAITHALEQRIKNAKSPHSLVTEYWHPKESCRFYEFFGPSMVIKNKLAVPAVNETILMLQYGGESDRAKNIQ